MAEEEFSVSIVAFPSDGFFWITFRGELTLDRMTRAHQEFTSHPDYYVGVDELLDFSQSTIRNMTSADVRTIRNYVLQSTEARPGRNVIVVNTKVEYGLGRMIAGHLGKDVPTERQICFSVREALEWLRPRQADALLESYPRNGRDD